MEDIWSCLNPTGYTYNPPLPSTWHYYVVAFHPWRILNDTRSNHIPWIVPSEIPTPDQPATLLKDVGFEWPIDKQIRKREFQHTFEHWKNSWVRFTPIQHGVPWVFGVILKGVRTFRNSHAFGILPVVRRLNLRVIRGEDAKASWTDVFSKFKRLVIKQKLSSVCKQNSVMLQTEWESPSQVDVNREHMSKHWETLQMVNLQEKQSSCICT